MRNLLALLGFIALLLPPIAVTAQSDAELTLSFSRDFGYSSGTGQIQGTFSMKVEGPDDLTQVAFYIDDQAIGEDTQAPFKIQFTTDNYPLGEHKLYAVGVTSDGRELRTPEYRREFVSASEGGQAALRIIVPTFALILGALLISSLVTYLTGRGKPRPAGSYGLMGGTICPKCDRPFSIHIWSLSMLVGRLDRCPHCGKWSFVQRAAPHELAAAESLEAREAARGQPVPQVTSEEEKLRKELEDSRFQE
jgi:hypothetical protein